MLGLRGILSCGSTKRDEKRVGRRRGNTLKRTNEPFAGFLQLAFHASDALGVPLPGRRLALDILKKCREVGNGGLEVVTGPGVETVLLPELATGQSCSSDSTLTNMKRPFDPETQSLRQQLHDALGLVRIAIRCREIGDLGVPSHSHHGARKHFNGVRPQIADTQHSHIVSRFRRSLCGLFGSVVGFAAHDGQTGDIIGPWPKCLEERMGIGGGIVPVLGNRNAAVEQFFVGNRFGSIQLGCRRHTSVSGVIRLRAMRFESRNSSISMTPSG